LTGFCLSIIEMAYDKAKLEEQAVEAITNDSYVVFVDDLVAYLPCSRRTFYELGLHESHAIKEALEQNKINLKVKLRKKWAENGNATTEIALYKLIGNEEEGDRINSQKTKVEGGISLHFDKQDSKL
jgi:hypothetical protein